MKIADLDCICSSEQPISMNRPDPTSFIIDSFLERPDEWEFDLEHDCMFVEHTKSGFKLNLYPHVPEGGPPEIFFPAWAKLYTFSSEEKKLLMGVISTTREDVIKEAKQDLSNRIVNFIDPPKRKFRVVAEPSTENKKRGQAGAFLVCIIILFLFSLLYGALFVFTNSL